MSIVSKVRSIAIAAIIVAAPVLSSIEPAEAGFRRCHSVRGHYRGGSWVRAHSRGCGGAATAFAKLTPQQRMDIWKKEMQAGAALRYPMPAIPAKIKGIENAAVRCKNPQRFPEAEAWMCFLLGLPYGDTPAPSFQP